MATKTRKLAARTKATPVPTVVAPNPIIVHPMAPRPVVTLDYVTRKATVTAESSVRVPLALYTSVTATVTTDTYRADPACVGIELEIGRAAGTPQRVQFDVPAQELDTLLLALTQAVSLADRRGVLTSARVACGEADAAAMRAAEGGR